MTIKNFIQESQVRQHMNLLKNAKRENLRVLKSMLPDDENVRKQIIEVFDSELARYDEQLTEFQVSQKRESFVMVGRCSFLGSEFIAARIALGWSHYELSNRTGISRSTIQDYEMKGYVQASFKRILQIDEVLAEGFKEKERWKLEVKQLEKERLEKLALQKNADRHLSSNQININPLERPSDELKNLQANSAAQVDVFPQPPNSDKPII